MSKISVANPTWRWRPKWARVRRQAVGCRKNEVVLLARGRRLADLQASGLILEDAQSGKRMALPVTAVAALGPADRYDSGNGAGEVRTAVTEKRRWPRFNLI